jgi:hypothetical protein
MKQTAVQWLVEQLENHNGVTRPAFENVIQLAKAMEKEQIIEAVESTIKSVKLTDDKTAFFAMGGEGYYTEQYESNN